MQSATKGIINANLQNLQILSRFLTRDFIRFCASLLLFLCLSGTQLLASEEEEGPRGYISEDVINFSKNSDWEGVWGEISQCNPLSTESSICDRQGSLGIYDCNMQKMTCKLSFLNLGYVTLMRMKKTEL